MEDKDVLEKANELFKKEFDSILDKQGSPKTIAHDIGCNNDLIRVISQCMFMKGFSAGMEHSIGVIKQ